MGVELQALDARIHKAWHEDGKMDWLGMENLMRSILWAHKQGVIRDEGYALKMIDETLAAFTKRGSCLDD